MKSVRNALNRRAKGEKGFTLVELLVVVIIIGILSAVAVPIYLNQRKAAWNSTIQSDVKNASLVVETAMTANNGKFDNGWRAPIRPVRQSWELPIRKLRFPRMSRLSSQMALTRITTPSPVRIAIAAPSSTRMTPLMARFLNQPRQLLLLSREAYR